MPKKQLNKGWESAAGIVSKADEILNFLLMIQLMINRYLVI